jgi:DNA-directed RNA polymerase specialized sigma24 family protein
MVPPMTEIPLTPDADHLPADPEPSETDWSMIFRAAHGGRESAAEAWDQLARRYWPAIYAYIRTSGRDVHQASDLTQGFVCDVMVGRQLLASADPTRGRFRTLLLSALRNYLVQQHRHATRQKRSPQTGKLLELDGDAPLMVDLNTDDSPEAVFSAQWGALLVRRILDGVRADCTKEGLGAHWTVFESRVVRPMLHGEKPTDYASLVDRLNLKDAGQAANMMITIKRRVARALAREVSATVGDPAEVTEELHALMRALERPTCTT